MNQSFFSLADKYKLFTGRKLNNVLQNKYKDKLYTLTLSLILRDVSDKYRCFRNEKYDLKKIEMHYNRKA